jgi:hypothetical protein
MGLDILMINPRELKRLFESVILAYSLIGVAVVGVVIYGIVKLFE